MESNLLLGQYSRYKKISLNESPYKCLLNTEIELKDYASACDSFMLAGSYSDARDKYKECAFSQGELCLEGKNYSDAIQWYQNAGDFNGAKEKYKEANYCYGEQLLATSDITGATECFYNASGYLDADTRIDRYYYELAENLFSQTKYFEAVELYSQANNYEDANTKISECYYLEGNKNFSLNYFTEAIECFSMCRGYKDTDEILLSYYYEEASLAYNRYIKAFSEGDNGSINSYYQESISDLNLCEGYSDSKTLIATVEKLYEIKNALYGNVSSTVSSRLAGSSVSVSGNNLSMNIPSFIVDAGVDCSLSVQYDMKNKTFSATMNDMYDGFLFPDNEYAPYTILDAALTDNRIKIVSSLFSLFSDVQTGADFNNMITNIDRWSAGKEDATFNQSFGGYNITINVTHPGTRMNWVISATK